MSQFQIKILMIKIIYKEVVLSYKEQKKRKNKKHEPILIIKKKEVPDQYEQQVHVPALVRSSFVDYFARSE